jgi:nucleotide-binding universal stress UspA family protein
MMRFTNILVPYDGSKHADRALDVAKDFLHSNPEAHIHVISVTYVSLDATDFNPDPPSEDEQYNLLGYDQCESLFNQEQKAAHRAMIQATNEILDDIERDRIVCDTVIRPSAVEGIEDYAKRNGCDLIIMGRRGLGGIRQMVGSVTKEVLHRVDLPVLTVK